MPFSAEEFPHLTLTNWRATSPSDVNYNCIAWANGDSSRWWQPGWYWPTDFAPGEFAGMAVLIDAFRFLGFTECPNGSLERHVEKVALYGKQERGQES